MARRMIRKPRLITAVALTLGLLLPVAAHAAAPANGADINGRTVYVVPLSWIRYGEGLLSKPYTFTRNALELKGRGKCSEAACPVVLSGIDLFARRTRVELAKPVAGTIISERTLRRGDEGDDVKKIQQALVKAGYRIEVDGKYGRGTVAAVKEFQRKAGVEADGNIGPMTRAKLAG